VCLNIHIWITFDTSFCVVQVGIALGFLIPPAVVKNHDELDDIGHDLNVLCYGYAIGPTVVLVLLLVCESATKGLVMHHSPSRQRHLFLPLATPTVRTFPPHYFKNY